MATSLGEVTSMLGYRDERPRIEETAPDGRSDARDNSRRAGGCFPLILVQIGIDAGKPIYLVLLMS